MEKLTVKSPSGRTRRTPVNTRNILNVTGKEPGYVYRVVNDVGDRIAELQDRDWEIVRSDKVRVGERRVDKASPEGSIAQVSVGNGVKAVVMRIKQEWYDDDQKAKNAEIDRLEQSIKQNKPGDYGSIEIERGLK